MAYLESRKNLVKYLEALDAIDGLTTYAKTSDEESNQFYPLATPDIVKKYNNCYCNHNNITAIIIEGKLYIIPTGIIKEHYIISCGLRLEKFNVPLSDCRYVFQDEEINKKWKHLLSLRDRLKANC